jgi:ribosome-associated protein
MALAGALKDRFVMAKRSPTKKKATPAKRPRAAAVKPAARAPQETAREFAIAAALLVSQTRCHDVKVLDVAGLSPITDFLVIGTGTSARQMRSVIDDLIELGKQRAQGVLARSGTDGESWMVVDFVNVVVHLFNSEARSFYDLENLWGDARPVEWSAAATQQ